MVSKVKVDGKTSIDAILKALFPLGGIEKYIKQGDKVFIKPNFNTSDPPPASTDLAFIKAFIEIALGQDPQKIVVGDSPTFFGNSKRFFDEINPCQLEKTCAKTQVLFLNDEIYAARVNPKARYLKEVSIALPLLEADKIILLPCLKTHAWAQYTGALKLAVGLMKPSERVQLHMGHLQEKIAELNLFFEPDLVIMDARKCFITEGPSSGHIRNPNLVLASTCRRELDIEGIKIIQSYDGNDLANIKPEDLPQIKRAKELGIK